MIPCKALRPSSARPTLSLHNLSPSPTHLLGRRRLAAARRTSPAKPHMIPPSKPSPTDHQLSSDRDDAFRINSKNKTVDTTVGALPLSPVMDPGFWEATRRHQVPKTKREKPRNSVERQLWGNAFAKALATPVRMCALTRTRLPGFFLQDFGLITHPETGAPWLIPHSLIPDEPIEVPFEPDTERSLSVPEASSSSGKGGDVEATTTTTTTESSSPSHGLRDDDARPRGPGAYVLARRDLLSSFVVNQSGFENAHRRMTATNFKHKNLAGKAVWRRDMDSYILDLLRQAVVGDLLYLSRLCVEGQRHYMVKCYGWGDVRFKHKGAVLWFGEPEEEEGQGSSDRTQTQIGTGTGAGTGNGNSNEPGPFATFDTQREDARHEEVVTTRLAVHNMPMLLGAERAGRVKEGAAALKHGSIFMLAGRRTADLQMKLWKLQGYLSDYREI